MPTRVRVTTDGACSGNPGPGAWATIIEFTESDDHLEIEMSGFEAETTNNQMELEAFRRALSLLPPGCDISWCSDSKNALAWVKHEMNAYVPHIKELLTLIEHEIEENFHALVETEWVKGHAGHPANLRCDELAREALSRGIAKNVKS